MRSSIATFTLILTCSCSGHAEWSLQQLIPVGYDKHELPIINGQVPVVRIGMEINEVLAVAETTQTIKMDFFYYQSWTDLRLIIPNNQTKPLVLDDTWTGKIWTPDSYFINAQSAAKMSQFNPVHFFVVGAERNVTEVVRMIATFTCKMDLGSYPQDVQYCPVDVASLSKPENKLILTWQSFVFPVKVQTAKFKITDSWTSNCTKNNMLGEFSCLRATIKMVRRISYYVIRSYAPTFLATIASFVGFWIPIVGWPARVAITITPLLSFVLTQNIGTINDVGVAYVTAMHWWMMWCNAFVFGALVEYAVAISWVHFINEKKTLRAQRDGANGQPNGPTTVSGGKWSLGHYFGSDGWYAKTGDIVDKVLEFFFGLVDYQKDPMMRNKVDYCSRIIFPFLYILFVLIFIFSSVCPWAVQYNNSNL